MNEELVSLNEKPSLNGSNELLQGKDQDKEVILINLLLDAGFNTADLLDYKIYGFSPEKIFNALMRRFGK
jgi:hypothetical protein